jgi:methylmalonyl-CoA/ethylmalonyl-CoA epimerase
MKKISHIGVAVADIKESSNLFSKIFNKEYKIEEISSENVITSFFEIGESKIELIADNNGDSVIKRYLQKKQESIHHIAFEVENIQNEIIRLTNLGIRVLNEEPKKGADNKLICFLHPKDTNNILIELTQSLN